MLAASSGFGLGVADAISRSVIVGAEGGAEVMLLVVTDAGPFTSLDAVLDLRLAPTVEVVDLLRGAAFAFVVVVMGSP